MVPNDLPKRRTTLSLFIGVLGAAFLLTSCARVPPYAPPDARVHHGPAYDHWLGPIAALPVECAENDPCPPGFLQAVETASRMMLEFQGHSIIDSELLNAETRRRWSQTKQQAETPLPQVEVEMRTGRDFRELGVDEQRELLDSIGVLALLRAKVDMGRQGPAALRPLLGPITVEFTLSRLTDNALIWRSRCTVHTGNSNTPETALEKATRCAIKAEEQL